MKSPHTPKAHGSQFTAFILRVLATLALCFVARNAWTATPAVIASTYLGGSGFEITWSCATDSAGNVYIAGDAQAADFPVTANALQATYGDGGQDGFVAKYDKNGKLLWCTFLGGSDWDGVFGLAVDAAGNAVVTGVTASTDFPLTANAVQRTLASGYAAFVTVISADGTQMIYSTYLGGSQSDGVPVPTNPGHLLPPSDVETLGVAIAIGPDGSLYLVGGTNTIDMPVTFGAAQPLIGGESDGFIARIRTDRSGSAGLMYLTYLGGATSDFCSAVAVDQNGNAFVTGETQSPVFPTTTGAFQRVHTLGTIAFVTKISGDGTNFIYSTLVSGSQGSSAGGGSNYNAASAIAVDSAGHAFIAGETNATDFPTTAGVVQPTFSGQDDGFVTELAPDGSSLIFSSYLGGSDYDGLFALKLDSDGNIFVGGYSASRDLPLAQPFQLSLGGYYDAWAAKLSPGGTTLLFGSYLGGIDQDSIYGLDLWNNQLYLAGRTASTDFPVTPAAPQTSYGGGVWDNFLTIVNLKPVPVVGVVSRKVHGSAGTFDLDLPLAGNPGIECRSGGANGNYTLVFSFLNTLNNVGSVTATATTSGGTQTVTATGTIGSDTHQYLVNLAGVPNASHLTVSLGGVSDSSNDFGDVSVQMDVLLGDVNGSGRSDSGDVTAVRNYTVSVPDQQTFRYDVNLSGRIDSGDVTATRNATVTVLP